MTILHSWTQYVGISHSGNVFDSLICWLKDGEYFASLCKNRKNLNYLQCKKFSSHFIVFPSENEFNVWDTGSL